MKSRLLGAVCALAMTLATATVQAASILFGIDNSTAQLITIDPATGAGTAVGSHGFNAVAALTSVPAVVPIPSAVWLFVSGLLGLVGMARRRKA